MSVKRSKGPLLSSTRLIRKAKKSLRAMPMTKQIELMVRARVMTPKQAERAKKALAEAE